MPTEIPYSPLCAWCNGPGDVNGSHKICEGHAAELEAETDRLVGYTEADRHAFEHAHGPEVSVDLRLPR